MPKGHQHKQSFNAVDVQGNVHRLHVYVDIIDVGTRANPHAEAEGLKTLYTDDGGHVNRLEKGKYQVVQTGQILRSDDADAP